MDRYETYIQKQLGEYIYTVICGKIAIALNERHQREEHIPDFVIYKGIEFITKGRFCLERFDKVLWDEIYSIATEEFGRLTEDEKEACKVYIDDLDGVDVSDDQIVVDICCEFETTLEHWIYEYVQEEMLNQRMTKEEAEKILLAKTTAAFPNDEDIDAFWDRLGELGEDLDVHEEDSLSSRKPRIIKTKYCS